MLITLSPGPHTTAQSTPPASNRVKPQGFSWAGPQKWAFVCEEGYRVGREERGQAMG